MLRRALAAATLSLTLASTACQGVPATALSGATDGASTTHTPLGSVLPPTASSPPAASSAAMPPERSTAFEDLVNALSEPDAAFFSDNLVSNETSYLQVAGALAARATPGGAYLGVGPEQSFSYIALTRPKVAFLVDIRRQNLILHLLYKALFERASSRTHFLALLVGRRYDAAGDPGPDATIAEVVAHADGGPLDEPVFAEVHAALQARVERFYRLSAEDAKTLELVHRAFAARGLDIRFALHDGTERAYEPPAVVGDKPSGAVRRRGGRRYPSLRDLLQQTDPSGAARGFLATEDAFRFVQRMEAEDRVVPIVGDFAGDRAMPGLAAHLKREGLTVSTFYVSNVEQYLVGEPKVWAAWARNVAALPVDDRSLFLRAYLDQGRKHPQQLPGHRAATVLQRIVDFDEHEQRGRGRERSFWDVATDRVL